MFGLKRALVGLIAIVIVAASFGGGVYVGLNRYPEVKKITSLSNKEAPASLPTGADFAPFWKAWNVLDEKYVSFKATTTEQDRVWGAISGLAQSYNDPYTVFFPPVESKNFEESINGEFQGVGMEIGIRDRTITIIAPLKGTPAFNAGIKSGDKVIKIDGKPTTDMSVEKAVSLIRGPKGTIVALSIYRDGEKEPLEFKIVRDTINIPTIDTEKRADGIFVIKLYSFSANSPQLFRNALLEFVNSGSDKLILDLRNNPGGYLEASVDMASWFLPQGKTIVTEENKKNGQSQVFRSKGYNIFSDKLKFIILVNEGSASASEILAGALSEYKVARLVGEKTFGKGSVQELIKITSETSLKVTVARWLTPNGASISEGGLKPDVEVTIKKEDAEKGRDTQMERAIELLLTN